MASNDGVRVFLGIVGTQFEYLDNGLALILYRASNGQIISIIGEFDP
jgi:hypothetical protein